MMNSQQQQEQQFQQNKQIGSGLTRYRTAPSSYFSSFLNAPSDGGLGADNLEGLISPRALSPETQRIFSRFMNSGDSIQENSYTEPQFLPPVKVEPEVQQRQQSSEYSSEAANSGAVVNIDNRIFGTFDSNREAPTKMQRVGGANSGLIRHSSSPAGLFADIDIENEFGTTRAVGTMNAETSFCSTSRIKSRMDFSSGRTCSSSGMMDPITEMESKDMGENGAVGGDNVDYITGFSVSSWDDSAGLSDDFLKGLTDDDTKRFSTANANDDQRNVGANRPSTALLSHHLSLPQAAMEKLLQDSVPCKIRAKRGCATHPRSIAERVRRTKISERMRKLQELVPNMEKQTNTSDMLDLAVDYIKDLQRQLKSLSDNREKCSCSAKQRS